MAGKGGYQAPSSPASVSGPGKYSQRTDGGPEALILLCARTITGTLRL